MCLTAVWCLRYAVGTTQQEGRCVSSLEDDPQAVRGGIRYDPRAGIWRAEGVCRAAVLVMSERTSRGARQVYVATIAALDQVWLERPVGAGPRYPRAAAEARLTFWRRARARLGELVAEGSISLEERDAFDARVAEMVPLPTARDLALVAPQLRAQWLAGATLVALSA